MTQDEIIEMVKLAGFERLGHTNDDWVCFLEEIETFAKLVAAKKEEDIIKIIQDLGTWATCEQIEKTIRAKGEA